MLVNLCASELPSVPVVDLACGGGAEERGVRYDERSKRHVQNLQNKQVKLSDRDSDKKASVMHDPCVLGFQSKALNQLPSHAELVETWLACVDSAA